MFRRKEETANDSSQAPAAVSAASAPAAGDHSDAGSASFAAVSTGSQAANNTYVPTAPSSARASEPARPAVPPATSYRPAPIAEFNRGAVRSPNDALRASAPATPAAAFGSSMADKNGSNKSNRRVLTVGNDILLKGEIATCDRLVIEGRVEAKLSDVHTVEIAEVGSFKGTAEVEDAEISGVFEGDLIVRNRLVVYASGEVRGNISYGEIEIERGGRLTGQIKTVAAGAKGKATFEPEKARSAQAKETAAA
jgi:cytoskeletal protein CcmA (bactofilin family)